jgi:hypothetical protein
MSPCPFGINGGEFPNWPVGRIVELAVKVGAQFVELPAGRLGGPDAAHAREAAASAGLAIHVNGLVSALSAAFASARAVQATYLVVADDAIERTDASRADSFTAFREAVMPLLVTLSSPAFAARSAPNASISPEMSVQTTRPPGATARAAVRLGSP